MPTLSDARVRCCPALGCWLIAGLPLAGLFLAIVSPVILTSSPDSRYAYDERLYHVPTVRLLTSKWPAVDVTHDPQSATSPGYHYFLATLCRIVPLSTTGLRVVNALVSLAASIALFWYAGRLVGPPAAALLTLPFLLDPYYLKSASYLVTDNAALLFFVLTSGCLLTGRSGAANLRAGVYAACATAVRQNYVWLSAGLMARVGELLAAGRAKAGSKSIGLAASAVVAMLMPLAVMCCLVWQWQGLTPPTWQDKHAAFRGVHCLFALALTGILGSFYLPLVGWRELRRALVDRTYWAIAACVACLALWPESDFNYEAGRWGGWLWAIVQHTGSVAHRWPLFPPLAVWGTLVIFAAVTRCRRLGMTGHLPILAALAVAWAVAQCANRMAFQRYFEPTVLIFLTWLFLPCWSAAPSRRAACAGPGLLALLNLLNALATLVYSVAA